MGPAQISKGAEPTIHVKCSEKEVSYPLSILIKVLYPLPWGGGIQYWYSSMSLLLKVLYLVPWGQDMNTSLKLWIKVLYPLPWGRGTFNWSQWISLIKSRPRHLDKGPKLKRLPKKRIKVLFPEKSEIIGKPYLMVVSLISGSWRIESRPVESSQTLPQSSLDGSSLMSHCPGV